MKNKKATINPNSKNDKYFHYTAVSLNYKEIEKRLRKNIENQTFCIVDKQKWKGMSYPLLKPLYIKNKEIYHAYVSKHNLERER